MSYSRREFMKIGGLSVAAYGFTHNVFAHENTGRQELIDALKNIAQQVKSGNLQPEEIDDQVISANLYTHNLPDPDLLIRTSGEMRVSNFLLWQLAYTEIYVTRTFWPDFRKDQLYDALIDYFHRERRFGKVSEQILENATG